MNKLQRMHKTVWDWRERMEQYFPTPLVKDSLRFSVCEAAEALDAHLRQNSMYKRNRDKQHSVNRELAQCAMMLLTALGPTFPEWGTRLDAKTNKSVDDVVVNTAYVLGLHLDGYSHRPAVIDVLMCIDCIVPDLEAELVAALEQLEAKHGEKVTA